MGTIISTIKDGQKPTKEELKQMKAEIRKAKKLPQVSDTDCPPSSPEALKEFAHLAVERNRRRKKQSVTIRISPDILETYKTMGNGYTGIMADVLKYAVNNPSILTEATK